MQLRTIPAKQGYIWIQQGLQIFRCHPINMLMLVMVYIFFYSTITVDTDHWYSRYTLYHPRDFSQLRLRLL